MKSRFPETRYHESETCRSKRFTCRFKESTGMYPAGSLLHFSTYSNSKWKSTNPSTWLVCVLVHMHTNSYKQTACKHARTLLGITNHEDIVAFIFESPMINMKMNMKNKYIYLLETVKGQGGAGPSWLSSLQTIPLIVIETCSTRKKLHSESKCSNVIKINLKVMNKRMINTFRHKK